ncbi:MAG: phosphopentomutase [Acidobacteriota bacterium]|nr:phosphopentomutase [Acidobacteriota bacterium]
MAPTFSRVIVIVMDSVGIGELPDAAVYGDEGSNTVGNIARHVPLKIPTLRSFGLGRLVTLDDVQPPAAAASYGRMAERSPGKDSVTGHWEMAGLVLDRPFPVFPQGFSPELIAAFEQRIGRKVLANKAASGTAILDELGAEHVASGRPIVYTSADSVFQIAAHEDVVPVAQLYEWCQVAYELAGQGLGVGRVIARPFGGVAGAWSRTSNRKDFALQPHAPTLLDRLHASGVPVMAIGKIEDLFAGRGITGAIHTASDEEGMNAVEREAGKLDRGLIFANLVDFDSLYGHRNDVEGYAANLERFDARLTKLLPLLHGDDLLLVTADHGNDPTTPSTDHSREYVPVFAWGEHVTRGADLGTRSTFADLGQTVAEVFGVGPLDHGTSFLEQITR